MKLPLSALATSVLAARLALESGQHEVFEPAQRLYAKHGFAAWVGYADYVIDDFSLCVGLDLTA